MKKQMKKSNFNVNPGAPEAWIVSSKDNGRKPLKKGKVYLKDDEEFKIEIFNPLRKRVLADIRLNGEKTSNSGLVLRPGERVYLDGFIDSNFKFVFKTYNVDNSKEAQDAIKNNGLLEVFFYEESILDDIPDWGKIYENHHHHHHHITYPNYYPNYPYYTNYCSNTNTNISNVGCDNAASSGTLFITNDVNSINTFNFKADNTYDGSINTENFKATGRVEKGIKSDQKFESVDAEFKNYFISSTIIKILPDVYKPIEGKELKKKKKNLKNKQDTIEILKGLKDLFEHGSLTKREYEEKREKYLSYL